MIIRGLDADHDWTFGKGKQNYKVGTPAIAENIDTRLRELKGNCFFNMGAGVDWLRLLGGKNTKGEIVLSCRSIILASYGVVQINSLSVNVVARGIFIEANVDTIYTQNITQIVEVSNG